MRAQICFEEALKLSKKEFEGGKSRRREKKESKKLSREFQEAPEEAPSHDPSTVSTFYSSKRAGVRVLGHRPSLPLELFALLIGFRSSRSSFGAPIELFFRVLLNNPRLWRRLRRCFQTSRSLSLEVAVRLPRPILQLQMCEFPRPPFWLEM